MSRTVICFPFAGGVFGGSHVSALGLIRSLDREQFEPLLVLHNADGDFGAMLRSQDIDFTLAPTSAYIRSRGAADLFGAPSIILKAARFLRDRDVAIVHTNEGAMHATWGLPARLAGAKLVWHHRSDPDARGLRYFAPWVANQLVSVSRFAAPKSGRLSAAGKCSVVYSPFDTDAPVPNREECRQALIGELGLRPDTRVIGYFGHFVARKRPIEFVEAILALRRRDPDVPLCGVIFGTEIDPGLEQKVRDRVRVLGLEQNVFFMGFRYPSDRWMVACDALLVTAVDEPFGRTLIEAMLLGVPIVAANSGGNREAIRHGETGFLATPDNAEDFARQLSELFRDPGRRAAMIVTAQTEARGRFGIDQHVESIMSIYRRLTGGRAEGHRIIGRASRDSAEVAHS